MPQPDFAAARFQMRRDALGHIWIAICLFVAGGRKYRGSARAYVVGEVDTIALAQVLEAEALADMERQVAAAELLSHPR